MEVATSSNMDKHCCLLTQQRRQPSKANLDFVFIITYIKLKVARATFNFLSVVKKSGKSEENAEHIST